MAKRLLKISMGATAGRSADSRLLPGEKLTGRWFTSSLVGAAPIQVEVWDKGYLILKSKSFPSGRSEPYQENGMLGCFLCNDRWGDEVSILPFKDWDDSQNIERIISVWSAGYGSVEELNLEIESPD